MEENPRPCLPNDLPNSRYISQRWFRFTCSHSDSPDSKTVSCHSHNRWHLSQKRFRTLNKRLMVSKLVSQPWRPVRPLLQAVVARQDLGMYSDMVTAPQPLDLSVPMAQRRLTTTGIQDVDLILSQSLKMNMSEVPSFHGSQVNKTTLGSRIGSTIFGKSPTYPFQSTRIRNKCQMSGLCGPISG